MWLAACLHKQGMEGGRKSQEDASTQEEGSRNKVRGDFVPTVCGIRDESEKVRAESSGKWGVRAEHMAHLDVDVFCAAVVHHPQEDE